MSENDLKNQQRIKRMYIALIFLNEIFVKKQKKRNLEKRKLKQK